MTHISITFIMIRFHDMILNPLFLHLINSMTAHQNFLVGMHDTSYHTPLLSAYQRCTDHLCVALWVFIRLFEKRGEVSNISAARCGHWRRPSWYFNYRKFRWSSDIIKIDVCLWSAHMTPWKKFGKVWHKFWWPILPNRSISHEGSWFSKRRRVNSNSCARWLNRLAS